MNLHHYQQFILPLLEESFDAREANNLFRYVVMEYFELKSFAAQPLTISEDELEELNYIFEKITNHYPVQYLFNKAYFYGLTFFVNEHVLIPRPETEELVHWIIQSNKMEHQRVLDIGTGSGCIAVALKKNKPNWNVFALDVSDEALLVAKKNADEHEVSITFLNDSILEVKK